ncbi:MAG: CoA-transferase subunit beta [Chloroflexota bacterium]
MSKYAEDYTLNELMCVAIARELSDGELGYIGIGSSGRSFTLAVGMPLVAARLAQLSHAPNFSVFWNNLLEPDLSRFPKAFTPYAIANWPAAASLTTADGNDMFAKGMFDIGFVSAAQVDRYGNMNITAIGPYRQPKVRLVGSLAQTEHLAFAHKPLCVTDLDRRVFVEQVSFRTGVGYLRGGTSRIEVGLEPLRDYKVITDKGVLGFHPETKEMTVLTTHRGCSIDDIFANMGFTPNLAEDLAETEPPTVDQVRLIRDVIDPSRIMLLE